MKKLFIILAIFSFLACDCHAAVAGKWGLALNNIATINGMNTILANNSSFVAAAPCISYNFTENTALDVGYFSLGIETTLYTLGYAKYAYYFGRGNLEPHVGLSYAKVTSETPETIYEASTISLIFGTAYNIYEGLSLEFDIKPISLVTWQTVKTDDPSDREIDYTDALFINIMPSFNLKWTF